MREKIKGNTLIFILIVGFVKIFELIFSSTNSIVGVTVIISILVLMRENLTKNPIKNLSLLLLFNIGQGIFTYMANLNMYWGLILNFIALASVGYLFSFKLNKILVAPFGLQYLFLLYAPIEASELPKRLLALGIGAILIMVVQFIVNTKNKYPDMNDQLIDFAKHENGAFSIREAYAIRIGIITALATFMVAYFNIDQGCWIVYTVFALTELYSEHCKIRSMQRMEGTLIGVCIILFLFIFIKTPTLRGAIILVAGYLDTYSTNYRDKMIFVTMSVMASVSLTGGTMTTAYLRIICVLIGVVLALAMDSLVFKREMAKA